MTVKEVLHTTEDKLKKSLEFVQRNFAEVRTGRANPAIVEGLHIDYYGTPTMLKQLASISVPDAHMLVIQPWDQTAIPEIEKAILKSNLGITP
ncbi:MAG TPA: ribosome recycling factor, partial [Candidatus Omnitrophota bacterium]|nr:ribosome recycling factor [Candidatus Omnitrophota bacterium]